MLSLLHDDVKTRRIVAPNGKKEAMGEALSSKSSCGVVVSLLFPLFFSSSIAPLTCARYLPLGRNSVTPRYGEDFGGCGMVQAKAGARARVRAGVESMKGLEEELAAADDAQRRSRKLSRPFTLFSSSFSAAAALARHRRRAPRVRQSGRGC